jgi:peptide/nickel transport system substrate-binding protein
MNFQSTTGNGPIIRQLYFRQAMAYLMDQQGVISGPLRGYGSVTVGPVGSTPVSKFLSAEGKQGDPFPFSIAKAKALLTRCLQQHGKRSDDPEDADQLEPVVHVQLAGLSVEAAAV